MKTRKQTKLDVCYRCVKYKLTCDGSNNYVKPDLTKRKSCMNFKGSTNSGGSKEQVRAFYFLYNSLRRQAEPRLSPEMCFAKAILLTCDDAWKNITLSNKKFIENYFRRAV